MDVMENTGRVETWPFPHVRRIRGDQGSKVTTGTLSADPPVKGEITPVQLHRHTDVLGEPETTYLQQVTQMKQKGVQNYRNYRAFRKEVCMEIKLVVSTYKWNKIFLKKQKSMDMLR